MKKPEGVSKEQWANYKRAIDLSLKTMNQSLDLIAEANFQAGVITERQRIIKLLEPFAEHTESCYYKKQLSCYREDCLAYDYQDTIELIKGQQK